MIKGDNKIVVYHCIQLNWYLPFDNFKDSFFFSTTSQWYQRIRKSKNQNHQRKDRSKLSNNLWNCKFFIFQCVLFTKKSNRIGIELCIDSFLSCNEKILKYVRTRAEENRRKFMAIPMFMHWQLHQQVPWFTYF